MGTTASASIVQVVDVDGKMRDLAGCVYPVRLFAVLPAVYSIRSAAQRSAEALFLIIAIGVEVDKFNAGIFRSIVGA